MEALTQLLGIGVEAKQLTVLHVCLRGTIVFIAGVVMLRCADKRFLSKMTALDAILGFILASMLARAINGSAALAPTIVGGFVLVFLHRLCCKIAARFEWFGGLVKGHEDCLIRDGEVDRNALRANDLTERDLLEELRQHGKVRSPSEVEEAYIERSGKISVIPKNSK
ncbi:MAG TPA: YetF domain-containing protein [Candidatus Paceibacterota bacterium]|nr:YetF domain-containing protein [Candidatus Paceibacterota bacterium]